RVGIVVKLSLTNFVTGFDCQLNQVPAKAGNTNPISAHPPRCQHIRFAGHAEWEGAPLVRLLGRHRDTSHQSPTLQWVRVDCSFENYWHRLFLVKREVYLQAECSFGF